MLPSTPRFSRNLYHDHILIRPPRFKSGGLFFIDLSTNIIDKSSHCVNIIKMLFNVKQGGTLAKRGVKYRGITREEVEVLLGHKAKSWNILLGELKNGLGHVDPQVLSQIEVLPKQVPTGTHEWIADVAVADNGQLVVCAMFYCGIELTRDMAVEAICDYFRKSGKYPGKTRVPWEQVFDKEVFQAFRQSRYGF